MAQGKLKISTRTLVVAAVILAIVALAVVKMRASSKADTVTPDDNTGAVSTTDEKIALAQCLTANGVKMYGASWCPHCAQQKKDFGTAAFKAVTYVECAVPGNNSLQTQACKDAKIEGYPTWRFADGTEKTGEQTLEALASAAGCSYGDVQAGAAGGTVLTNSGAAPDDADLNAPTGPRAQ